MKCFFGISLLKQGGVMKTLVKPEQTILLFAGLFFTNCQNMDLRNNSIRITKDSFSRKKDQLKVKNKPKLSPQVSSQKPIMYLTTLYNYQSNSSNCSHLSNQSMDKDHNQKLKKPQLEQQISSGRPVLFHCSLLSFNSNSTLNSNTKSRKEKNTKNQTKSLTRQKLKKEPKKPKLKLETSTHKVRELVIPKLKDYKSNSIGNYKRYRNSISMDSHSESLGENTPESTNSLSKSYQEYFKHTVSNSSMEISDSTTTPISNNSCITPFMDYTGDEGMNIFEFPDTNFEVITRSQKRNVKPKKIKKKLIIKRKKNKKSKTSSRKLNNS